MHLRCYNILNFLKTQKIIMNFTNDPREAEFTITSNKNIFKHVRIAKHWNKKTADPFAVNFRYQGSNEGLIQLHPSFNNVFINSKGKIQINNQVLPCDIAHLGDLK